jgi:hypothetical protein
MPEELEKVLDPPEDTPVKPDGEFPADTDPVPAPADIETAPAVPDEYQKAFEEEGLHGQFSNPMEVIRRAKDFNRYSDSLYKQNLAQQQELAELRKAQAPRPEAPNPERLREKFDTDPLGVFKEAGLVSRDELAIRDAKIEEMESREHRRSIADSLSEHPELKNITSAFRINRTPVPGMNPYWDKMNELIRNYPGLDQAPVGTIVQVLLPQAKRIVDANKKPPVEKVPQTEKDGARGTAPGKTGNPVTPDFSKPEWTSDKIQKWYADRGLTTN